MLRAGGIYAQLVRRQLLRGGGPAEAAQEASTRSSSGTGPDLQRLRSLPEVCSLLLALLGRLKPMMESLRLHEQLCFNANLATPSAPMQFRARRCLRCHISGAT